MYISCIHNWPYRDEAVLLPVGHGVELLALGHGLLCPFCWLALHLLRCWDALAVHLDERVFPVSLCPGRSSQPSWAISRVRAVSPSLGGATASHLRNSFGLPPSGVPQCDVCPFLLLLHSESADLSPGCSLASLVG